MRVICTIGSRKAGALIGMTLVCAIAGCGGSTTRDPVFLERQEKYRRLAIVCAPKGGADPDYARMVLQRARVHVGRNLAFLDATDYIFDASVDAESVPPRVRFANMAQYDAVVCLLYSYTGDKVYLDFHMLDTKTDEQIWHHQYFGPPKPSLAERLGIHGLYVPTTIRAHFYGPVFSR